MKQLNITADKIKSVGPIEAPSATFTETLTVNAKNVVVEGDSRLTDARTPTSHVHGNITNDGKLGTASRIVVTDTSKKVTVGSIDPANLVVTTDARLSDARTPKDHKHTKSDITDFPTIPTVNNGTLTIKKNGAVVTTFSANQSGSATADIIVPTKVSDLTNDSGFITSSGSVASATKATNDGNGNNIVNTYETKADATAKAASYVQYDTNSAYGAKAIHASAIVANTLIYTMYSSSGSYPVQINVSKLGEMVNNDLSQGRY